MLTEEFFEEVTETLFYGSLPDFQKQPLIDQYEEFVRRGWGDIRKLAYVMATTYWETGRYKYNEEINKGAGRDYGVPLLMIRGKKEKFHGRGWVQLTWLRNYAIMSVEATHAFGRPIDLVNNPNLVFEDGDINAFVTFEGMERGLFTGKSLSDYINESGADYHQARRVINGVDKAAKIASIAESFEHALRNVPVDGETEDEPKEKDRKPFRFRPRSK